MYTKGGFSCVILYNEWNLVEFAAIFPATCPILAPYGPKIKQNRDAARFFLEEFLIMGDQFSKFYPHINITN